MSTVSMLSFFVIMAALAAIPSASVALVVARSASLGIRNGIAVAIGIVAGDLIFVSIAILGMTVLAATIGALFSIFKYAGGAYLIWLGVKLLRSNSQLSPQVCDSRHTTLLASFASGLLLTLGDMKAILFYASIFPALTNASDLSSPDIATIVIITIITVGGVKTAYAIAARVIVSRIQGRHEARHTRNIAGGLMVGLGSYVLVKS